VAVLQQLAVAAKVDASTVAKAIRDLGIDPSRTPPFRV